MLFKEYNFKSGRVNFNNYDISPKDELIEENDNLTEDMLQIEFKNDTLLDVGWYLSIGCFIVFVIQNCDWDKPLLRLEAHSYSELKSSLDRAMDLIDDKLI
ncbi:MAG: hypothetical protein E7206_10430 [Clostridium beijerinckii]|nr:hypothetical protein [Clostridium beijerinckii]